MRHAKVHVSVMGDETRQNLSLRGLQSAAGFLQSKIAKELDTRYTPRLMFVLDQGVKKSIEMARILREVLPRDGTETQSESAAMPDADGNADHDTDDDDSDDVKSLPNRPR